MTREIDRRTMLKGGAVLAAGALLSGLGACSSNSGGGGSSSSGAGTTTGGATTSGGAGSSVASSTAASSSAAGSATGSGSASSSAAPSSSSSGKKGGTLRFGTAAGGNGDSPDPALASRTMQLAIAANCYDTLTYADENYALSPALATEWSASSDASKWTFKLRSGVTFHDGSPLTSKDVAYTFKRILDPALAAKGLATIKPYLQASGIDSSDPNTVVFNLEKPNAFLPVILSAVTYSIVKDGSTDFTKGNGTGPFTITAFDSAAKLGLARWDGYWKSGQPYLDAVQYSVIAEDATRLQALTSGSQDVIDNITGASTLLLTGNVEPYMIKAGGWVGLTMFGDTAPFNNPKVIQAMQYAADRNKIMGVVAPGIDVISPDIPIPPSDPFFPSGLTPRAYDPDKAKSLLQAAGVSVPLAIDVYAYQGDKLDTVVTYKSTAAAAGITVNVQNVPHDTFFGSIFKKKPAIGISVARLHVSQALPRLYSKGGDLNLTHFQNDQLDQLVAAAMASTDEATQKKNFGDALTIVNDNASNVIPGWEGQVYGKAKNVSGVVATNGGQVYLAGAQIA
jgi:peptide/nickel transport system substrate-binding protein